MREARAHLSNVTKSTRFVEGRNQLMTAYALVVGIDIACKTAQVEWQLEASGKGGQVSVQQTPSGHAQLVRMLAKQAPPGETLVVMEATGNYWMKLALALHQAGCAVSVLNPAQARHFAKARLQRAKTDAVDARLLVQFGRVMPTQVWTPPPPVCEQLQQLLARRDDLIGIQTQESNRLHALQHLPQPASGLLKQLQAHLNWLAKHIKALERDIRRLLSSNHPWQRAVAHLETMPGLGPIGIASILATTHAFARCENAEQASAFAGLVPNPNLSGTSVHGRASIAGGNEQLRRVLYMCAMSASRFNPVLRDYYQHLRRQGKLHKVALVAVAHKLLTIAWALVTKDRDFDPNFRRFPA